MSKKLIKLVLGLFILGVLAVGVLIWNINPIVESFRPKLAQLISDTIHQPVQVGRIELRLFPTQAVELSEITLAGGEKGGANVGRALLVVDIMALLKKRLEVSEVTVDNLIVTVTRNADGSLTVGGVPLGKKAPGGDTAEAPKTEDTSSIQFHTKSFRLTKSKISIEDKGVTPPQSIELADIDVTVDNITKDEVEKFAVSASLLSQTKGNLTLNGSVKGLTKAPFGVEPVIAFAMKKIDLARLEQLAAAYGKKIDKLSMKDTVDIELSVKGSSAAPHAELTFDGKPAAISFGGLFEKAAGTNFQVAAVLEHKAAGDVELPKLEITLGGSKISLPMSLNPMTQAGKVAVNSQGLKLSDLQAFLPMLRAFGLGGEISIDLTADLPGRQGKPGTPIPKLSGSVDLKNIEAKTTLPAAEPDKAPEPLVVKDLNGKIEFQGETVSMKGLKLNVAGQALECGIKATGLLAPSIQFALRAPTLAFGPLLKAVKAGGIEAMNASSMDGLDVRGGFDKKSRAGNVIVSAEKGEFANLPLSALKVNADFVLDEANKPLKATLQPSTLGIFGGTTSFQGSLSPEKLIAFQMKAAKIDIKRALDVVRPNSRISMIGTLEALNVQITARQPNIADTLAGPVTLQVSKGSIEGFNIAGQALAKVNAIPGLGQALLAYVPEKYAPLFKGDNTSFERMTADANLNGGNTTLNSFKLVSAAYEVSGEGTLQKSGEMEIHAQLTLNQELANGMVTREPKLKLLLDDQGGIAFPITIIKRDGVPIVIPDVSKLAKSALKNTAKEAATRVLDKGLEKVAPGLGGALESLFK